MQWVGQETMYDLRKEIFEHLQRLPMSFFDRSPVGRLVTRATTDVDALNDLFASGVAAMLNDFVMLFGLAGWLFYLNHRLALAALSPLAVHDRADVFLPHFRARREPPHPHGHRADQRVPAGAHQRHGRGAAFQPRGKIAQAVCRAEPHPHGSVQGRDRRLFVFLPGRRIAEHGRHRAALLGRRRARDRRNGGNRRPVLVHDVRAALLPADSGPERKIQHSADGHGGLRAHLPAAR